MTYHLRLVAVLCCCLSMTLSAFGQPAANSSPEKEKPPERLIYLPFKNLKSVFEKPDGSVLIPYADYIKLWEKAFGEGLRKPEQAPVPAVISSASYAAKIEKDVAQVSVTFVVQVLEKGWAEIPVKFGEAAIGKLTSDTGKVLLRGTGNGTYALLLPTPGEHQIQLELSARVRTAPDGKSLELEVPPVGITDFELQVPEADQTIELKPRLAAQPVEVGPKESRIKANVGATEKISVRWHPRVGTKPDMELLASATNQTLITVADGLIHTDAWITYEILRGQLEKVKIAVPKGQRILDITSDAKVKEWKTAEEDHRQVVTVELLSRAEGKVLVEVHTEQTMPDDAFDVAGQDNDATYGIHALDVIRESGMISVKPGSDLTLTVEEQRGLLRVDENEIDPKLRRPSALYYKYYSPAFRLRLTSKPVEPRMTVDHSSQLVFRDDQLRLKSVLNYSIDRAGVFELKMRLPDELVVENVLCDRMKQFDVSSDKTELTISLREKTLGDLSVTVISSRPLDPLADEADQLMPILEPLNAEIENGRIQVYAPESIELISDMEKVVSAQPDPAPKPEPVANARLVSSWIYNRRPVEIPVRTVRKPTRLSAVVVTNVDVKQKQVQVTTRLSYAVEYAGLDTFRFAVPEAVADSVQIVSMADGTAPAIKQQSRAENAEEGWVTWTIVMQREVLGTQPFEIKYDLIPVAGEGTNSELSTIEAIRVIAPFEQNDEATNQPHVTLSRTIGEITIVKDRALSISANATGGDVEQIDVRELQYTRRDGFVAFRYFKQPVKLEVTSSKFDVEGVIETVVSKSLVEVVFDRSGAATHRCRYVLRSSERQRLRIDLPENVEILGVLVDRKLTALEKAEIPSDKGWTSHFVNVARMKSSDESFSISVIFRHEFRPAPFQNAGGKLIAKLPVIGGGPGAGVAVQQLYVKVWVPPEYVLIGTPTIKEGNRVQQNFSLQSRTGFLATFVGDKPSPVGEQSLDNWIGDDTGGVFDFPTEGKSFQYMNLGGTRQIEVGWWHLPFYTSIVSGSLILIGLILRNTSWENKLTILVLGIFAACAYALRDADLIFHGLHAASYGLAAIFAIWIIHGLLSSKNSHRPVPPASPPPEATLTPSN